MGSDTGKNLAEWLIRIILDPEVRSNIKDSKTQPPKKSTENTEFSVFSVDFFRGLKAHKLEPQVHALNRAYPKGSAFLGNPTSEFRFIRSLQLQNPGIKSFLFEKDYAKRRQNQVQREVAAMLRRCLCYDSSRISHSAAEIFLPVAVQNFFPIAAGRDADSIIDAGDWSEITDDEDRFARVGAFSQKRNDAAVGIAAVNPFKSFGLNIHMQRRLISIHAVDIFHPLMETLMSFVFQQVPI